MELLQASWDALSAAAIWRNLAFEPNFLIPAFQHLNSNQARLLVIEASNPENPTGPKLLCGLMPLIQKAVYGLPIETLEIWKHDHCFDATPLIRKDCGANVIQAAFSYLQKQNIGLLSLDTIAAESDFQTVLSGTISKLGLSKFHRDAFSRAALRPSNTSDEYYQAYVSKSVKKNHRRLTRRLADQGAVTFEQSNHDSDFEQLANDFLEIEKSGWKGEQGTALACDSATKDFYQEMITRSGASGKARFLTLNLDGKPIAMISDLVSGKKVYSYKTTFDEKFSNYSPGLQVEIKNIDLMHADGIEFADSCTSPDNATINRIWGQRIEFQSMVVGLQGGLSKIATRLMPWMQTTANQIRKLRS